MRCNAWCVARCKNQTIFRQKYKMMAHDMAEHVEPWCIRVSPWGAHANLRDFVCLVTIIDDVHFEK